MGKKHDHIDDHYAINLSGNRRWSQHFSSDATALIAVDNHGNGPDSSFFLAGNYQPSPTALIGITGGIARIRHKTESLRSRSQRIELRAGRLLPHGFTANALASVQWLRYENNLLVLDGDKREHRVRTLQLSLLNRKWTFFGFSPQVSLIRQLSDTNYQLDNYKSTGYQLNFQRQF